MKTKRDLTFSFLNLILLIFTSTSCSVDRYISNPTPIDSMGELTGNSTEVITPPPLHLPLNLPTEPATPYENTPTAIPPIKRTWGEYSGPTIWPPIEIPPPMGILPKPDDQVNILLLGDDQRPNEYSYRTDSIMLLTLNPSQGSVALTSFPRDLYVYAPGWTMQRINVIQQRGGFDLMAITFAYNFGVKPDYYAKINVWMLQTLVDSLGGVDVEVSYGLVDQDSTDASKTRSISSGNVHMDGATVAWYCRSRNTTSDFDRARRHQEVLQAIFWRLLKTNAFQRAPELYNIYRTNVTTNLTFENVVRWIPFASRLSQNFKIRQTLIGGDYTTEWTVPTDGSKVLLPKREAVMRIMRLVLTP